MGRNRANCHLASTASKRFGVAMLFGCSASVLLLSGCSKIGSQAGRGVLINRSLPFVNQNEAPPEDVGYAVHDLESSTERRVPQNPVREVTQEKTEIVKTRPPKLSAMPKMTLYAEPVVNTASQVSYEQDIATSDVNVIVAKMEGTFDPAAEPPAQIFEQPVITESIPAAEARALIPMLFEPESRKLTSRFNGTLRDEPMVHPEPQVAERLQQPTESKPLIVVGQTTGFASPADVADCVECVEENTVTQLPKIAHVQTQDVQPAAPANIPRTDASAFDGKWVSFESNRVLPEKVVAKTPEVAVPAVEPARDSAPESALPMIVAHLASAEIAEDEVGAAVLSDLETSTQRADSSSAKITIDASLKPQSLIELNLPVKTTPPAQSGLATVAPFPLRLPVVKPAVESVPVPVMPMPEKIQPTVAQDILPLNDSDFQPTTGLEKQMRAGVAEFADSLPDFETDRRAPLQRVDVRAVASSYTPANISPAIVDYAPAVSPMPIETDVRATFDTSENQFQTVAFDPSAQDSARGNGTEIPAVGVEELMKLNAVTWQSRLAETVDLVEEQLAAADTDAETRTSLEINLRLLDVLSRQMSGLIENQQQFSESENQYWQDQLEAITAMLKIADPENERANEMIKLHSAHETLNHLRKAVAHLESLANLSVISGAFCTEVSGYGQFRTFERNAFPAGQPVLVYCEIENFTSTQQATPSGSVFQTRLRGSYAIYDSSGRAVQQAEFPVLEDVARKRRRDFYMHLPITIGQLMPGNYELHLLIEDLGGNKTASLTPALNFSVIGAPGDRQARR